MLSTNLTRDRQNFCPLSADMSMFMNSESGNSSLWAQSGKPADTDCACLCLFQKLSCGEQDLENNIGVLLNRDHTYSLYSIKTTIPAENTEPEATVGSHHK